MSSKTSDTLISVKKIGHSTFRKDSRAIFIIFQLASLVGLWSIKLVVIITLGYQEKRGVN